MVNALKYNMYLEHLKTVRHWQVIFDHFQPSCSIPNQLEMYILILLSLFINIYSIGAVTVPASAALMQRVGELAVADELWATTLMENCRSVERIGAEQFV